MFKLLLDAGKIRPALVEEMLAWQHPGFSVDRSVHIRAHDGKAAERLLEYFWRPVRRSHAGEGGCPFSLAESDAPGEILRVDYETFLMACRAVA